MSGHSKWHNIRLRKGKADAQRGKMFTKITREIIVAARAGGGNPDSNLRLRMAMQKAREASMPAENIKRGIQRGTGELEGVSYEEVTYEGYGPGGVALFIETLTDNQNRTVADIRHRLGKHGGSLGTSGSVAWQFERKGEIYVDAERYDEETIFEAAIEAGAEDVAREDNEFLVTSDVPSFNSVQEALKGAGIDFNQAELTMVPTNEIAVEGKDAGKLLRLLDALDELDDIQKVHSNADIDEASLAEA